MPMDCIRKEVLDFADDPAYSLNKKNLSPRLLRLIMLVKHNPSFFRKLGDLLETRVDISAYLQELLCEPVACLHMARSTFGYAPTIARPARPAFPRVRARVLSFSIH